MNSLGEEEGKLFTENRYPYLLTKADLYLRIGPEKYRRQDFFSLPDVEWENDELEVIAEGCRQVLEGKGLTPKQPFVGLHVIGFSRLFSLFHFENIGRETSNPAAGKFLDKIVMRHLVDGGEVTFYNLVEYDLHKSGNT